MPVNGIVSMLQQVNGQMATTSEVDSLRKLLDRIAYEMESKPTFKDLDSHAGNLKGQVTDVEKELSGDSSCSSDDDPQLSICDGWSSGPYEGQSYGAFGTL